MKKEKEQIVAEEILKKIGGIDNIKAVDHCSTRLRLTLKDNSKYKGKEIEDIDGVKGQFISAGQHQVILGTGFVDKVYDVVVGSSSNLSKSNLKEDVYNNLSLPQKISRTLGDVFIPIIPVLVATGLFKGIISTLLKSGVAIDPNFLVFANILTQTAFAFLPVLVTWSAMKIFGGTPVIGIVLGLMLVAPQLPNASAVAGGTAHAINLSLFGITIPVVGYQGSVLPALVLGIIAAKIQKFLRKYVPNVLDLIITPFVTLLISMFLGLLLVGPVLHEVEFGIFSVAKAFIGLPFGLGGLIIGGTQQAIVVTGMHHIFLALETELLATTGLNAFNGMISGGIVAQGAAALAVAFRTRNKKKRALYISSSVPAFLGITEPAIFGVNLRFGKPFIFALTGGATAGLVAGILHMAGAGLGISAIPGIILYASSLGNILRYILIIAIGGGVAFTLTYLFVTPDQIEKVDGVAEGSNTDTVDNKIENNEDREKEEILSSPAAGKLVKITEVKDEVFSKKLVGDGYAVLPSSGDVYSPVAGKITNIFPTKHAIGIRTDNNIEILIHMGIDTVELKGKPFQILVKENDQVNFNTKIAKVDLEFLKKNNKDSSILVVITNMDNVKSFEEIPSQNVEHGEKVGSLVV